MRNLLKAATLAATITATTFVAAAMSPAAQALTVMRTVNGTSYDITTVTGSYNALSSTLESQVWWNDRELAMEFATAVDDSLGLVSQLGSSFSHGPLFAYDFRNSTFFWQFYRTDSGQVQTSFTSDWNRTLTWATAAPTAVPIPTPALLPGLVGMGVAALRKRKQEAEA